LAWPSSADLRSAVWLTEPLSFSTCVPLVFFQEIPPMTTQTRRVFLLQIAAASGTTLLAAGAHAQAKVDEKDPQAVALGYVADTTKADAKKYPKHSKDQKCTNCALYQGKATDAAGGCPLFGAKQVAGAGWCSAWAKKG
jgi:hypothetical protein